MRRLLGTLAAALVFGLGAAGDAAAQGGAGGGRRAQRPAMERLAGAVQRQLGLTDDQAARLRDATRRFATQREALLREERAARVALREAVAERESADAGRVARLIDELLRMERRRVDLRVEEQRELARFLTPVQRAQFMAMQERASRAAQQLRAQRDGQGPPRRPPLR